MQSHIPLIGRLPFAVALSALVLASVSIPAAAEDTSATPAPAAAAYHLRLTAFYRYKMPLRQLSGDGWNAVNAAGLAVQLPSGLARLSVQLQADLGTLTTRTTPSLRIPLLEIGLLTAYTIPLHRRLSLALAVSAGLSSAMAFLDPDASIGFYLFQASESEFGFTAGVEPLFLVRCWRFGIPLSLTWILSEPHRFVHLDLGMSITWEL